jgi:hypothetical protein
MSGNSGNDNENNEKSQIIFSNEENNNYKFNTQYQTNMPDNKPLPSRISVGMILSPNIELNSIDNEEDFKTPRVKLTDRLIDGEIRVLGSNFDEDITTVKREAFESDAKSENIFNKIIEASSENPSNSSSKRKSSSVTSTSKTTKYSTTTNKSIKNKNSPNKHFHLRDSLCNAYNIETNKGKYLFDTVQERKNYEEKILNLNNRIKKLKDQEEELNKKVKLIKKVVVKEEKIKQGKDEIKNVLTNKKQELSEYIQKRKEVVLQEKNKRTIQNEKAKEDLLRKNKNTFDMARTDKMLVESMKTQYNSHILNVNNYKYIKAKQETIQVKTQRFQKQAEKEEKIKNEFEHKLEEENSKKEQLKRQLKDLEELEETCLMKLKTTLQKKNKELSQLNTSQVKKYSLGLNTSVDDGTYRKNTEINNTSLVLKSSDKKRKVIRPKSAIDLDSNYNEKKIFK